MAFQQEQFTRNNQVEFYFNDRKFVFKPSTDPKQDQGILLYEGTVVAIVTAIGKKELRWFDYHPTGKRVAGRIPYERMKTFEEFLVIRQKHAEMLLGLKTKLEGQL